MTLMGVCVRVCAHLRRRGGGRLRNWLEVNRCSISSRRSSRSSRSSSRTSTITAPKAGAPVVVELPGYRVGQ